jgi:hypothetical protein
MVLIKSGTTVEQLNSFLARAGAAIVACQPRDTGLGNGLLMLRFPTSNASALYERIKTVRGEGIVAAAAPDVVLGLALVPDDEHAASAGLTKWKWNNGLFGATGGNWGWEQARVPQMWNVKTALEKRGVSPVPTCILDVNFAVHQDLRFPASLPKGDFVVPSQIGQVTDDDHHGNHVSGIVGATYGNDRGIDGVNPFADLVPFPYTTIIQANSSSNYYTLPKGSQTGYQLVENVKAVLKELPTVRIINVSLGFNWTLKDGTYVPLNSLEMPIRHARFYCWGFGGRGIARTASPLPLPPPL